MFTSNLRHNMYETTVKALPPVALPPVAWGDGARSIRTAPDLLGLVT